jgi:hypothetical protein
MEKLEINEFEIKSNLLIDYKFNDLEEAVALEKLKNAAFSYDGRLSDIKGISKK